MQEAFGRVPLTFGGAFSADSATVTFGLGAASADVSVDGSGLTAGVGFLTQQINFQYSQPVTRIYEIGTRNMYYLAGRVQGNASMARILGPRQVFIQFYANYGNVCNAGANLIDFNAITGCDFGVDTAVPFGNFHMQLTGVVLTGLSSSVRAEDMVISEQLSLMFMNLLLDET